MSERAKQLRQQIAFANGLVPPAPIMVSVYEAETLAKALEAADFKQCTRCQWPDICGKAPPCNLERMEIKP